MRMSVSQPSVGQDAGAPGPVRTGRAFPVWAKWLFWGACSSSAIGRRYGCRAALAWHERAPPSVMPRAAIEPTAVWPRGARPAPDFRLTDQHGRPFSLGSLRGRPVLVTFIDPLCRNLCPLEARVLSDAVRRATPETGR